jgi:hypothetical protein
MLVPALVVELAIDPFHVCVLRRLACLDQLQRHAVAVGPAVEGVVGELGTLIGPDHLRQAAELLTPLHRITREAMVDRDIDASFVQSSTIVRHLSRLTVLETVTYKIHRPYLVQRQRHLERATLHRHTMSALALRHVQTSLAVDPLHALAVNRSAFATDQGVDAAVVEPTTTRSERLDRFTTSRPWSRSPAARYRSTVRESPISPHARRSDIPVFARIACTASRRACGLTVFPVR